MSLTPYDFQVLAGATLFSGILSLSGTSIILISFFIFKAYNKRVNRMVASLSFSDFMSSLTFVISSINYIRTFTNQNECLTREGPQVLPADSNETYVDLLGQVYLSKI